jgi:anti-sigma factor RsiW
MKCPEWNDEAAECARRGVPPSERFTAHLANCPECRERWDEQDALTAAMRRLSLAAKGERSPDVRRRQLLREQARLSRPPLWLRWDWAAGAAALLAGAAVLLWTEAPRGHQTPTAAVIERADSAPAFFVEVYDRDDFVPVPYAPEVPSGVPVEVVRSELSGAELAGMGIDMPGAYADDFAADVVVGDDGMPQAVRLLGAGEL